MADTLSPTGQDDDAPARAARDVDPATVPGGREGDAVVGWTVTIARPRDAVYRAWRDLANLPWFLENVVRIEMLDDRRSRWTVKAPGGGTVMWDARITADDPGRYLAWESEPGADVSNSGWIRFADAPGGRGTVVSADIAYDPPAGAVGRLIAKVLQREPAIQVRRDLRRFKQLMETGEIATAARTRAEADEQTDRED